MSTAFRLTSCVTVDRSEIEAHARRLFDSRYSIHFHVWDQTGIKELLDFSLKGSQLPFRYEASQETEPSSSSSYAAAGISTSALVEQWNLPAAGSAEGAGGESWGLSGDPSLAARD